MVEAYETVLFVNLGEAVHKSVVLVCVNALHLRLDDIDWVVAEGRAEARKHTGKEVHHHLPV